MSFDAFLKIEDASDAKKYDKVARRVRRPMKRKGGLDKTKKRKIVIQKSSREFDFLKRIYYAENNIITKYKINRNDLLVLYAIYSEDVFDAKTFYTLTNPFRKKTLPQYIRLGLIDAVDISAYNYKSNRGNEKTIKRLYKPTFKAINIVTSLYNRLVLKSELSPSNASKISEGIELLNKKRVLIVGEGINVVDNEEYIKQLQKNM